MPESHSVSSSRALSSSVDTTFSLRWCLGDLVEDLPVEDVEPQVFRQGFHDFAATRAVLPRDGQHGLVSRLPPQLPLLLVTSHLPAPGLLLDERFQ
jgi:hypothetical protein